MGLTPEQHAIRRGGIPGSEIAAVCGMYPYQSAINVWESKMGLRPAQDDWKVGPLVRGRLFERPLLEWYSLITERTVKPVGTLVHPERPLVIATPDGISCGQEPYDQVVVEAKNSSWRMGHLWGEPWSDEIPDFYLPQVIWEMAVTGLRAAHVVVYMGDEPQIYCVPWDEEFFEALYEVAEQFWRDYVLTRTPPPPDATEHYKDYLQRRFPKNAVAAYRLADDAIIPWVERLRALRQQEKTLASERLLITNTIKEWVGEHAGVMLDGERIDYKANKDSAKTDWKALAHYAMQQLAQASGVAANDELIQQFTQMSAGIRPLTPRFKKGA